MNFVAAALSGYLSVAFPIGQCTTEVQRVAKTIQVGIYQNEPKVFIETDGKPAGFWVDLLDHIANIEGWSLEYVPCQWERCLQAIEQGQLDLMIDVAYSEVRDRRFDFNQEVVFASWSVVYARSGVTLNTILDLDQKRVAVLRDSIQYEDLLEQTQTFGVNPLFIEVADFQEMFQLLDHEKVDAGVVNRFFGQAAESQYRVVKTSILVHPSRVHFIAPEGAYSDLLVAIDHQLKQLVADPDSAYYQALSRWLEPPKQAWVEIRHVLIDAIVYVPLIGLVAFAIWNRALNQEIKRRRQAEACLSRSEQRFRNMAANVPGAIFRYVLHPDKSDAVIYMSQGCYELWEVKAEDAVKDAKILWDVIHPDDRAAMYESVMVSAHTLQPWFWQWRITTSSGRMKWLEAAGRPERHQNGDVVWDTLIMDVSDRKRAETALQASQERLRLVTENMSDLVCLHHPDGRYLYVTPSSQSLLGFSPAELIGRDPYALFHPGDLERVRQESQTSISSGTATSSTYRIRKKSGEYIWIETLTQPIFGVDGQVIHLQTSSRDVSDRVKAETQLKYDALHDRLTGLPNRSLLMERIDLAIKRTKRYPNAQFALLFLDLDHFKVINDSLGHLIGDELLLEVAKKLTLFIRDIDLAARLGGDEFVILLEEIENVETAVRIAQRILEALQVPLNLSNREVFINASIGIVVGTTSHLQAEELLRDADLAMYQAKHKGRGQYAIFDPAMHFQVMKRLNLEHDLRQALEKQEFVLHYQPIVHLETMTIQGFEALIRWQHPQRGLILPGEFIETAEEIGLLVSIGQWVLHRTCQQLVTWQAQFPTKSIRVSINLSVQQLQEQLLQQLGEALTEYSLQGSCLTLEITESMLVENVASMRNLLAQLKVRGVHLSIDDFGTGYSCLSYLHQLPVDSLKIDRTFVSQSKPDSRNLAIAESIIALSNLLGLNTIAEGIETPQQLEWLQQLGCKVGQGFLFSPPVSALQATGLLQQRMLKIPFKKS